MSASRSSIVRHIVDSIFCAVEPRDVMATGVEKIGNTLGVSRCVILLFAQDDLPARPPVEWSSSIPDPSLDTISLSLAKRIQTFCAKQSEPLCISDIASSEIFNDVRKEVSSLNIKSVYAHNLQFKDRALGILIVYQCDKMREWSQEDVEFLEEITFFLSIALNQSLPLSKRVPIGVLPDSTTANLDEQIKLRRSEARYRRLVEHSDAIIFHVNSEHAIIFISRRALDFFGMSPEDFIGGESIYWFDLIHPDDRQRVRAVAREMQQSGHSFDEEFRVINNVTGRVRWLLTRLVPVKDEQEKLIGWDGFGIDITTRRETQEALVAQSKKVRALYTVSASIRGFLDPPSIASRGLSALCEATGADAGLCYLHSSSRNGELKLISHTGFSEDPSSQIPNIVNYVATQGQSVVLTDLCNDPRAGKDFPEEQSMRSAVIVPISVEDETLGAIGLFSENIASFDGGDVMLVSAAANQIGLASRQANLFAAYRRQTNHLSALYRISHELTRSLSLDDIFSHAFSIIRDELGLKRLWLGLLNETGTRIIGQAAYGPGWKRRLVEINVEIVGSNHPLAQVITSRKPVIIDEPTKVLNEFGVRKIFSKLGIHSVVLVPLISSGQILGVLAVQPTSEDSSLNQESMTLLSSLANEIASVLLAKQFENRIAESDKMRTAGLLAAGIAHNFNNLLQAVLGQASLLDMQASSPDKVKRAAKMITEAAMKGASLVKKLLAFAHIEKPSQEECDISALIERNSEVFRSTLGGNHRIVFALSEDLPKGIVDPNQLMQILLTLLSNAKEAIEEVKEDGGRVEIFTKSLSVRQNSPHFEVPFGDYILIGVRDDGAGMNEETKRRCFEPFFTTKNVDSASGLGMSGSGLGLAAAYALARSNGGRLVVNSRSGHGSLFTIYLPVSMSSHADRELTHSKINSVSSLRPEVQQIPNEQERHLRMVTSKKKSTNREKQR
jgi:PAS domain S-box-containing protein